MLPWPSQSANSPNDLIEILLRDLKKVVHKQMQANLNELNNVSKKSELKFLCNDVRH